MSDTSEITTDTPVSDGGTQAEIKSLKAEVKKWQGKYNGVQGHIDTLNEQITDYKAQITDIRSEYETQLSDVRGELKAAQSQLATAQESIEGYEASKQQSETELAALRRDIEVTRMITRDYPALSELHADGLLNLNGIEEDSLQSHLEGLNEKVSKIAGVEASRRLDGTTPDAPTDGRPGDVSSESLYDEYVKMTPGPERDATLKEYLRVVALEGGNE